MRTIYFEKNITHHFPLDEWRQAVHTTLDKGSETIKVVLDYISP